MNLFVTGDRGVILFGPLPNGVTDQQSSSNQYRCVHILREDSLDILQLWKLEQNGITREEFSLSE